MAENEMAHFFSPLLLKMTIALRDYAASNTTPVSYDIETFLKLSIIQIKTRNILKIYV